MRTTRTTAGLLAFLLVASANVPAQTPIDLAAARATDPVTLGWMVGSPVPPDTRFASHPKAGNVNIDPTSLPAYRALAEYLMSHPH